MADRTALALRTRIAAVSAPCQGAGELAREICDALGAQIPFDFGCFALTDPDTGLATQVVKTGPVPVGDDVFACYEFAPTDINQFRAIAKRRVPVGILRHDTRGRPELCARYREFLAPFFGFHDELRIVFRFQGQTWGLLGLYRAEPGPAFTPAEASLLAAAAGTVTTGIRRVLFAAAGSHAGRPAGPAVIVVDQDNRVKSSSPAGQHGLAELGGLKHGALPLNLLAAVCSARGGAAGVLARIRTDAGWLAVRGAVLSGDGSDDVVITLDPAGPQDITPLALAAFGLTSREQEVARLVMRGEGTAAIAGRLHLSPLTVQDHLKSVFAKAGVTSRRELVATVGRGSR
jgi:DNA-binding CsgD family transcriptional regulator